MELKSKIYVAGHNGFVGSTILRKLKEKRYSNLIYKTYNELDLTNQSEVDSFFKKEKPEYVIIAAARVGGILANAKYPAEFVYQNMMIAFNVIHASYKYKVKKLLNLGSSCIYPKMSPQPIKEEYLLTGELGPTNEAYAIAKISAIKLCKFYNSQYGTNFISVMPTNLFGPNDNFDLETGHVIPALIRRFHEAKLNNLPSVELWGTGAPRREFLYVEDLAEAAIYLMNKKSFKEIGDFVNIGAGKDITIKELAEIIKEIIGYKGDIKWDASKPDGTPRKLLDLSKIHALGWEHSTSLKGGIKKTYEWFLMNYKEIKDGKKIN